MSNNRYKKYDKDVILMQYQWDISVIYRNAMEFVTQIL